MGIAGIRDRASQIDTPRARVNARESASAWRKRQATRSFAYRVQQRRKVLAGGGIAGETRERGTDRAIGLSLVMADERCGRRHDAPPRI